MDTDIFLMVIAAAVLHATWNALVKRGPDKNTAMSAVILGMGVCSAATLPFTPAPAVPSWPWIAASVVLHMAYQEFLKAAYRLGDLTQVYPIARGSAPLIVALVSVTALGVTLSAAEWAAVLLIGLGIASLGIVRRRDGLRNGPAAAVALVTGCFIAGYSLVDGVGVRLAGTSLGFIGWVLAINAGLYVALSFAFRPGVLRGVTRSWPLIVIGGLASFVSYALVVYAFTQAPIALVTALRETSIIFALLIGVGLMGERLDLVRVVSTMVTLAGAALLRLARG